ncbi:DUF6193 family natural product biosynthesis protein [Streptomyces laurentii]|uniref:DUF6193 family natural product biosynthesis protein n=1 Tax=Streptomyces laurentii TaxID=39478 RepID=UPI0036A06D1E
MNVHENDPYPDVTAAGGLDPALRREAESRGLDLGLSPWPGDPVVIDTRRGYLTVDSEPGRRLFRLRVHIPEAGWDLGATDDLGALVEAIAAWRQGVPHGELEARFDFLDLDAFTRAREAGEPTVSQWADLLATDFHRAEWPLLRRLHADEALRNAYPTISHHAVRLRVDPMYYMSRQVLVYEPDDGRYKVLRVGVPGAEWTEVPSGALTAHLRSALYDDPSS